MSESLLPFRTVPEEVLKAHKDRMGEVDVRVRRLSDIQMIDGVDLMAMILEIEHYRRGAQGSGDGYTPATSEEVNIALGAFDDFAELNTRETNMKAALDEILYRRGSIKQPKDSPHLCEVCSEGRASLCDRCHTEELRRGVTLQALHEVSD